MHAILARVFTFINAQLSAGVIWFPSELDDWYNVKAIDNETNKTHVYRTNLNSDQISREL
ncbi:MAG: hypothetical protein AAGA46_11645 [Cyanobacteria bacterium P01_F01_bin.13]